MEKKSKNRIESMMLKFKDKYDRKNSYKINLDENVNRLRRIFMNCELTNFGDNVLINETLINQEDPSIMYYLVPYFYTYSADTNRLYKDDFEKEFAECHDDIIEIFDELNLEKLRLYNFINKTNDTIYRELTIVDGKVNLTDFIETNEDEDSNAKNMLTVLRYMVKLHEKPVNKLSKIEEFKETVMLSVNSHVLDEDIKKYMDEFGDVSEMNKALREGYVKPEATLLVPVAACANVIIDIKNVQNITASELLDKVTVNALKINKIIDNNLLFTNVAVNEYIKKTKQDHDANVVMHKSRNCIEFNLTELASARDSLKLFSGLFLNLVYNRNNENVKKKINSEIEKLLGVKGIIVNIVTLRNYFMLKDYHNYRSSVSMIGKNNISVGSDPNMENYMVDVPVPEACFTTGEKLDIEEIDGLYKDILNIKKKMRIYTR